MASASPKSADTYAWRRILYPTVLVQDGPPNPPMARPNETERSERNENSLDSRHTEAHTHQTCREDGTWLSSSGSDGKDPPCANRSLPARPRAGLTEYIEVVHFGRIKTTLCAAGVRDSGGEGWWGDSCRHRHTVTSSGEWTGMCLCMYVWMDGWM